MKKNYLLYLFLFLVFFGYSSSFANPSTAPRWLVVFFFVSLLPFFYKSKTKIFSLELSFSILLILIFWVWNLSSFFWSIDKAGFLEANLFLMYPVFFLLLLNLFAFNSIQLQALFRFLLICLFLHSVLGIAQYFGFDYFYQIAAPAGTFVNKNYATPVIPLLLPFLVYQVTITKTKKLLFFYSINFIATIIYLIISVTRSSWLSSSIVFLILITAFVISKYRKQFIIRILPLLIIIVLFFVMDVNSNKKTTMHRDYREIESLTKPDSQLQQRLDKWKNGIEMIKAKPLTGFGAGNFDASYPLYHNAVVTDSGYTPRYFHGGIHNILLQIFIELGAVGFLILVVFGIRLFLLAIRNYKKTNNKIILLLLLGLFGFLIDCFWNNSYQHPVFAIILVLFVSYLIKESDKFIIAKISFPKSIFSGFRILFLLFSLFLIYQISSSEIAMKKALFYEVARKPYSAWKSVNKAMKLWKWRSENHYISSRIGYSYFLSSPTKRNWKSVNQMNEQTLSVLPNHYMPNLISFLLEMQLPNPDFSKKNIDLFIAVSPASKKGDSYEMLAEIYEKTGELKKAVSFYEKAFQYKPEEQRLEIKIETLENQIKERGDQK